MSTMSGSSVGMSGRPHKERTTAKVVSFCDEILSMMHAFGDVAEPSRETASKIDDLAHEQISNIFPLAADVAELRQSESIGIEEILFLLRNKHQKLVRFLHYLEFKDTKAKVSKGINAEEGEDALTDEDNDFSKSMKRVKICRDFLACIDDTLSVSAMLKQSKNEEVRLRRNQRADRQTRHMTAKEYIYFSECRQITFIKKMTKFRKWFAPTLLKIPVQPNSYGWESIAYLTHELVAELMDLALLVQADEQNEKKESRDSLMLYEALEESTSHDDDASVTDDITSKHSASRTAITQAHLCEALRRYSSRQTFETFKCGFGSCQFNLPIIPLS